MMQQKLQEDDRKRTFILSYFLFVDYEVQLESQQDEHISALECENSFDQGYSGSQENQISLETSDEKDIDIINDLFNTEPKLNDCSFHTMCAQASGYPDYSNSIMFDQL